MTTKQVTIPAGGEAQVHVKVGRSPLAVTPLPITVTLHNPPAGVSAADLTMENGIDEDDLVVKVQAGASPVADETVTVRASNGMTAHDANFSLTITVP